jgi:16S rRNA processing protein RimM
MGQASGNSGLIVDNLVVVGKIGAPYGVRGWVKVHSFTEPKDNLFGYPLLIQEHSVAWRPLEIEEFKAHGDGFVAKLAGVADRDQAALITNAEIAVLRENLPELDKEEFYWADLIGLTVFNQDNIELGKIEDYFETGANDVIVVQGENGSHLIPFVPDMYVLDIDLSTKQMRVQWDPEI